MSTVEVEARFHLDSAVAVSSVLASMGVFLSPPVHQDDQAYAPEGWSYGDDRIAVAFARLRTQADEHLFTVKRPICDVRTCIEHECLVSDRAAMHSAIMLMGYRPTVRIVKTRRTAKVNERIALCVDTVEGVGDFVEVEVMATSEEDHAGLRRELEEFVAALGIDAEPCTDTYDSLVHAAAASHQSIRNVTATAA
jgi:adenylate cyclase class 2